MSCTSSCSTSAGCARSTTWSAPSGGCWDGCGRGDSLCCGPSGQRRGGRVTVRIVTDSACDLPDEVVDGLGITVVPLMIRFGDEELV
ncbi:MAG: DegV family protein, partial [Actinomycetota bacterium]